MKHLSTNLQYAIKCGFVTTFLTELLNTFGHVRQTPSNSSGTFKTHRSVCPPEFHRNSLASAYSPGTGSNENRDLCSIGSLSVRMYRRSRATRFSFHNIQIESFELIDSRKSIRTEFMLRSFL